MDRRNFLKQSAGMALGSSMVPRARGAGPIIPAGKKSERDKRKLIGVCSWSLHGYFAETRPKDFKWAGEMLDLLKYPELIADKYHVHNFELVNSHFESTSPAYLRDLRTAVKKAHGRVTNIPVDYDVDWEGKGLCDPDDVQWRREIEKRTKWIDIARELDAESIRPNPGGTVQMTDLNRPIAAYRALGEYGKSKGIKVLIENHGNVAAKAGNIVDIIKAAGREWTGTLPDFGNFPESDRYMGLEIMFPFAHTVCHARGLTFDTQGRETGFDFPRCVRIAETSGFKGVYSAEFAGPGDPYEGTEHVIEELLNYLLKIPGGA